MNNDNMLSGAFNPDYSGGMDAQTNIISTLVGGSVATVADIGSTIYNSLVPESYEVETEDLLRRVSDNALAVYNEHPDAIKTASFVGGLFLPTGAALKGLNMMRKGAKGMSWFSDARKAADIKRLEELMLQGPAATREFKAMQRTIYGNKLRNDLTDVAAMEAALIIGMNDHPYMEDYLDDPVKHFGLSMALGGVIGGGLGHIVARGEVKGALGASYSKNVLDPVLSVAGKNPNEAMMSATTMGVMHENIKSLGNIIDEAEKATAAGDLTKGALLSFSKSLKLQYEAALETKFQSATKGAWDAIPAETRDSLRQQILTNPELSAMDEFKLVKVDERYGFATKAKDVKEDQGFGALFWTKAGKNGKPDVEKTNLRIWMPELGGFVDPEDVHAVGRANALRGVSEKELTKHSSINKNSYLAPNNEASVEVSHLNTPAVDARYIKELTYTAELDAKKLTNAAADPQDLARLNGLYHSMRTKIASGELAADTAITVTSRAPVYTEQVVQKALNEAGVVPDYVAKMNGLNARYKQDFSLNNGAAISNRLEGLLTTWIGSSGMTRMRNAMNSYLRPSQYIHNEDTVLAKEFFEHPRSVAFRKEMAALSTTGDENGFVYLWRGMHVDNPTGSNVIDSYAFDEVKAANHGKPKMYKVQVKDILGVITDNALDKDGKRRAEILVGSPARPPEATIKIAGKEVNLSQAATTVVSDNKMTAAQLRTHLVEQKQEQIQGFLKQGKSIHEAAIRTNTPVDTVKAFHGGADQDALQMLNWFEYTDPSRVHDYLNAGAAPIAMHSNVLKKRWVDMQASMDQRTLDQANKSIMANILMQSKSPLASEMGTMLLSDDMQRITELVGTQLGNVNQWQAGNRFFQSADAYVRAMGEVGEVLGFVGKRKEHMVNQLLSRYNDSLAPTFNRIKNDQAAMVELGTAHAVRSAQEGHVWYENRQFWRNVERVGADGKRVVIPEALTSESRPFRVTNDAVDEAIQKLDGIGKEILTTHRTMDSLLGRRGMSDIGYWFPPLNPRDKEIAYVHNTATGTTKLLIADTADNLKQLQAQFEQANQALIEKGTIQVFNKGQQEYVNILKGRTDDLYMREADVEMRHSGASAPAVIKADATLLEDLVSGLERVVNAQATRLLDIGMSDVTAKLRAISKVDTEATRNQPLGIVQKVLNRQSDPAGAVLRTMLGLKELPHYDEWDKLNGGFESTVSILAQKVRDAWQSTVGSNRRPFAPSMTYADFAERITKTGQLNPYSGFGASAEEAWLQANTTVPRNEVKRAIAATNSWAAIAALRFGEIAQPLVNAMSMPILMASSVYDSLPAAYLGANKAARVGLKEAMMQGVAGMNSAHMKGLNDKWLDLGYFKSMVSESTEALKLQRAYEPGLVHQMEKAAESSVVNMLSRPADWSEEVVRRVAMNSGYYIAKKTYPGLGEDGATIFAKNFMDRVIGNYHASQRPVFFQGTMGTALGLFQTYSLTMAQALYRNVQLRNYKALGATMLAQNAIFGTQSLPGYSAVSELIGQHYSDDHFDLTTGTIRAIGPEAAKAVVYGLPSSLGPGMFTRGDLDPRINTPLNVLEWPVFNMAMQTGSTIKNVATAMASDTPIRGALQALSLQSVSRPLARMSELGMGASLTQAGTTMQGPEDVWSTWGVLSRLMSTRPTEEALLRETEFMRRTYEKGDRDARQALMKELRTAIRSGDVSSAQMEKWALGYMDNGGTPAGWRAALNQAVQEAPSGYIGPLADKLKPNSALNLMIDMMDGTE